MKSENKNFLYNVIYQMFIYIFPLITIPYVSRILGVDNIGIYSYTYSIVNCLMLFAMLGINNYGNREISKNRDDKDKMSKAFFSIYGLQLLCAFIILCFYIIFLLFFCDSYRLIFTVQIINLISVFFDINWFFFGLEKFKLTINRNIIIKLLSTLLIFVFVKDSKDLVIYTFIMGVANLISQLYLFTQLPKNIIWVKIKIKNCLKHLKPCLLLFIPVLAYSIYRIMDKTMIGYLSTVTELGYYENSEKLINIPISVITALGTVMLPRMSYLIKKGNSQLKQIIFNSMKLALLLSVNMSLGLMLIADDISIVMFGEEYLKSGTIIELLCPTILIGSWASVIRTQFLIPMSRDKIYVYSTIGGALVNLCLNLIFISKFGAIGACIGTIAAELFLCVFQTIFCWKDLEMPKYLKLLINYLLKGIGICLFCYILTFKLSNIYLRLGLQVIIYIILFVIFNHKYLMIEFLGLRGKKCDKKR